MYEPRLKIESKRVGGVGLEVGDVTLERYTEEGENFGEKGISKMEHLPKKRKSVCKNVQVCQSQKR